MQVFRRHLISLIAVFAAIAGLSVASPAFAVSRCGTFESVPTPGMASQLAAFDDGTLWAIGGSADDPATPALLHFDGTAWSEQALPAEADGFAFGASGSTPDGDAWFAATRAYSVYEIEVLFLRVRGGTVDRIDTFLYPSSINTPGAPVDISASSADDVWALTASGDVIRFDGSSWHATDVPPIYSPDQRLYPKAIYASAPDDVWAVGYGGSGRASYIGYTQHWDGSSWTRVSTPFDGQDPSFFRDIDGSGPNDIWVAGDAGYLGDILLHWDGVTWIHEQGPASGAAMAKVMTMEPGNAWVVPYSSTEGDTFYYWNGTQWSEGARLELPGAVTISWHDVAKTGTCDAWAVGAYYDGTTYHPLAARLMPGNEPPPGNLPPVAVAQVLGPDTGPVPFNPSFSSASSSDSDGSIITWHWDFGDGTSSTLPHPANKVYDIPGVYAVTLTVTDNEGATGSDTLTVTATDSQCTTNCLRVTDDMSFQVKRHRNKYRVVGKVRVKDENGAPVPNASANATWTLPDGSPVNRTVTTNRRGVAKFRVKSTAGTYTLDVTDLRLDGYTFDPDNSLLSGSTSAP